MLLTNVFYYLDNFQRVLDSIADRYADLLCEAETDFIRAFRQLPCVSRALTVRMVMRKPRLFTAEQLQYAEVGPLPEAMQPLLAAGWVTLDPELSLDELFGLFTKQRLIHSLDLPRTESQFGKAALLERVESLPAPALRNWSPTFATQIFRLNVAALCDRFRLLYFGDFRQTWSEFVLADLGITRFENFEVGETRAFSTRRHWDDFERIYRCRERLYAEEDPSVVLAGVPAPIEDCQWLEARRQRVLFRIGQALERADQAAQALEVFERILHPGAAVRAIRIRERFDEPSSALAVCEAAITVCMTDNDRLLLQRTRHRLRRRLGLTSQRDDYGVAARPLGIDLVLEEPNEPYSVEHEVGAFLMRQDPDAKVYYVENCLMNSLFGLLCWRALFAPVEGAFFHSFHREPADLADAHFFERRRDAFGACLAELDDGSYRQTIFGTFESKQGIDNGFVAWPVIDIEILTSAVDCIPARHLKPWFELMAKDFQSNRCGFPDLVQLWRKERRYRLIEVKAPGDRLQNNQRRVLSLCAQFDIPVAVCKVQWKGRDLH